MPTCSDRVAATCDLVNAFVIRVHWVTVKPADFKLKRGEELAEKSTPRTTRRWESHCGSTSVFATFPGSVLACHFKPGYQHRADNLVRAIGLVNDHFSPGWRD